MKKYLLFTLAITSLLFTSARAISGELWVVTVKDPAHSEMSLDRDQVADVFLGGQIRFGNIEVIPIDRKNTSLDIRNRFYQQTAKMSSIQLKAYWSKRMFSQHGYPPMQVEDLNALKKELKEKEGSVSFIDSSEFDPSAFKIILKLE